VVMESSMQLCVTLSVTEAELLSATTQHMLYAMHVLESMGLKVKKPMIMWMDNKGALDLFNNWSVSGRARHVDVHYYFLHELKEEELMKEEDKIILTKWV